MTRIEFLVQMSDLMEVFKKVIVVNSMIKMLDAKLGKWFGSSKLEFLHSRDKSKYKK